MSKNLLAVGFFVCVLQLPLVAQIPPGYYDSAAGLYQGDLKTALHNIIDNHSVVTYSSLWTHFQTTDDRMNDAGTATIVHTMYSDDSAGPDLDFTFVTDQCGSAAAEGDCYNREHTTPKSYWGGSTAHDAYTDIHHVVPSDGYNNSFRSNYPYAIVDLTNVSYTTNNGSMMGDTATAIPSYSGNVFEPADEYKGDFARMVFYTVTRYENEMSAWHNQTANGDLVLSGDTWPSLESWAIDLYLQWHDADPVDQKEIDRNNDIYTIQGNRNPFIDEPQYAHLVWDDPIVLTVDYLDFSTKIVEGEVILNWEVQADEDVISYEIQESNNAVLVRSHSVHSRTGNTHYQVILDLPDESTYYRVLATNDEGNQLATSWAYIKVEAEEYGITWINTDVVRINLEQRDFYNYRLVDSSGRIVDAKYYLSLPTEVTLSGLTNGVYFLEVFSSEKRIVFNLVRQ